MAGGGCSRLGVRQLRAQRSGLGPAGVELCGDGGGLLAARRCSRDGVRRLQLSGGGLLLQQGLLLLSGSLVTADAFRPGPLGLRERRASIAILGIPQMWKQSTVHGRVAGAECIDPQSGVSIAQQCNETSKMINTLRQVRRDQMGQGGRRPVVSLPQGVVCRTHR